MSSHFNEVREFSPGKASGTKEKSFKWSSHLPQHPSQVNGRHKSAGFQLHELQNSQHHPLKPSQPSPSPSHSIPPAHTNSSHILLAPKGSAELLNSSQNPFPPLSQAAPAHPCRALLAPSSITSLSHPIFSPSTLLPALQEYLTRHHTGRMVPQWLSALEKVFKNPHTINILKIT